jgi:hypothetical protein
VGVPAHARQCQACMGNADHDDGAAQPRHAKEVAGLLPWGTMAGATGNAKGPLGTHHTVAPLPHMQGWEGHKGGQNRPR